MITPWIFPWAFLRIRKYAIGVLSIIFEVVLFASRRNLKKQEENMKFAYLKQATNFIEFQQKVK